MTQQTNITTATTLNYLNFECGDLSLRVPECAMSEGFKVGMGITTGIAIGTVAILFGVELINMINKRVPVQPVYYVQQQSLPYYYPQNMY